MTSAPSLSFEPRSSRIAMGLMAAIGTLAAAAMLLSGLPAAWRLGSAIGIGIATLHGLRSLAAANSSRCSLLPDGGWTLLRERIELPATLKHSHDLGFLLALHFRTEAGRRIDVVLWPDSIPPDVRRRLRVWLGRQGGLR